MTAPIPERHPDRSTRTEEPMSETEPALPAGCSYPDTFAGRLRAYSDAWRNHAPDDNVIGEGPDAREPLLLRSDLDATLTEIVQLDRKLDNLRFELNARIAAESADAAAGSYAGRAEEAEARAERAEAALAEMRERPPAPVVVWIAEEDGGDAVVFRDPDRARQHMIDVFAYVAPGDYHWKTDVDQTHEYLMRGDEPTAVKLWMVLVDDGAPPTVLERAADEQGDGEGGGHTERPGP